MSLSSLSTFHPQRSAGSKSQSPRPPNNGRVSCISSNFKILTLLNSCSCWRSGRGGSGNVRESGTALLAYDELEVINSNVAEDFVAPLCGDDNFVIQDGLLEVNSAKGPGRNSIMGSQIPDQFLANIWNYERFPTTNCFLPSYFHHQIFPFQF